MKVKAWINIQTSEKITDSKNIILSLKDETAKAKLHEAVMQKLSSMIEVTIKRQISVYKYKRANNDKFTDSFNGSKQHYECEIFIKGKDSKKKEFVVAIDKHATIKDKQKSINSIAMQYINWGFAQNGKTSQNVPPMAIKIDKAK